MNCRQAREGIRRKLDGALDPEVERSLGAHLASCPRCRRELASLETTVGWLENLRPVHAPAGFDERVLERVRRARRKTEEERTWREILGITPRRWMRPVGAGVGVVVAAALAGPGLVRVSSHLVTSWLAEPLARWTVRLVEASNDPEQIEQWSDRAREVSSPIGLVGKQVYGQLLDRVVPIALWCTIGIACLGFLWWVARYNAQRRTRDAGLAS